VEKVVNGVSESKGVSKGGESEGSGGNKQGRKIEKNGEKDIKGSQRE
jgi:hypothetical protein